MEILKLCTEKKLFKFYPFFFFLTQENNILVFFSVVCHCRCHYREQDFWWSHFFSSWSGNGDQNRNAEWNESSVYFTVSPKTQYFAISWLQCILTWTICIFIIYRSDISLETIPTERMPRPILSQCRQLAISCHFLIPIFYSFTFELQLNQLVFHVKFGIYHPWSTFHCFADTTTNFVPIRYILFCWIHTHFGLKKLFTLVIISVFDVIICYFMKF